MHFSTVTTIFGLVAVTIAAPAAPSGGPPAASPMAITKAASRSASAALVTRMTPNLAIAAVSPRTIHARRIGTSSAVTFGRGYAAVSVNRGRC
ncbi:uncharacterized protein N7473_000019 [Penicillium subrubescens]|uniref:uncharacterized protein n=1 Tax=Penicillium subrubescens TaxID=1316194 RepID=UPI0025457388|nr:uncharacterized protein N7473_000019 [Penicillium subrubescens]KAJ5910716.1 hypothetical protein N7473_000019 [Penicillium subrubescens]